MKFSSSRLITAAVVVVAIALSVTMLYQSWGNSTSDPGAEQGSGSGSQVAAAAPNDVPDTTSDPEANEATPASADVADDAAHSHQHVGDFQWGAAVLEPSYVREDGLLYEFELNIVDTELEILPGLRVPAWGYNGTVPGPEIRVPEGSYVKVHFTNTHHQPHTIHWHGIPTEQQFDGVLPVIPPGETYTYEFYAAKPGTHFYHCHFDSYRHLDLGMYGAIIIEPKDGPPYDVDAEYVMILDDWDTTLAPLAPWEPNHNYFLVNGRAHPAIPPIELRVDETVLVRVINVGYQNVPIHLHGTHFQVMESDGYPLPMPLTKDTLDVAPGERYDILISGARGVGSFPFHSHNLAQVTNNGNYPGGIHLMVNIVE